MPCYTMAQIRLTELWKVDPRLFGISLRKFVIEMEAVHGKVDVKIDGKTCTIRVAGELITVDMAEGTLNFRRGMEDIKNALKRNYSETVVQHVSQNPGVRRKFNMRQTGQREYVLQKRI